MSLQWHGNLRGFRGGRSSTLVLWRTSKSRMMSPERVWTTGGAGTMTKVWIATHRIERPYSTCWNMSAQHSSTCKCTSSAVRVQLFLLVFMTQRTLSDPVLHIQVTDMSLIWRDLRLEPQRSLLLVTWSNLPPVTPGFFVALAQVIRMCMWPLPWGWTHVLIIILN